MELTVTPKAQKWFDSEIDLPETYGIRFWKSLRQNRGS